jgi:hypothetical protein
VKRFLSVVLFSAVVAAWVGAQGQAPRPSPADQAKMIQRNRALYHTAVNRGLNLTKQFDALDRAGTCTELAKEWAKEVETAAKARDHARVAELGKQLSQVVEQGVVPNLEEARKQIKAGSLYEKALEKRRDDAVGVLTPLESVLRGVTEYDPVRKAVAAGVDKIYSAAKIDK